MLNQCTFLGRLIRKPELRNIAGGKCFVSFSIAVDRDRPNQDGEWISDFIDCVAWNKLAEKICSKHSEGDLLVVTGRLQNRNRTDSAGNLSVVAEIYVLDCRKVTLPKPSAAGSPALSLSKSNTPDMEGDDSPLPFKI